MEAYRGEVFAARYRVVQAAPHVDRGRRRRSCPRRGDPRRARPADGVGAGAAGPRAGRRPAPAASSSPATASRGRSRSSPRASAPTRRCVEPAPLAGTLAALAAAHRTRATRPHAVVPDLRAPSRRRARPRSRRRASDGVRPGRPTMSEPPLDLAPRRAGPRPGRHPRRRRGDASIGHGRARCTNGSGRHSDVARFYVARTRAARSSPTAPAGSSSTSCTSTTSPSIRRGGGAASRARC